MCIITKKSRRKSFTGYKYCVKIGNRYFSFWTGVEYKIGPVEGISPMDPSDKHHSHRKVGVGFAGYVQYNKNMFGKTGVYIRLKDCWKSFYWSDSKAQRQSGKIIYIRMTISGDLYNGIFGANPLVIGNHIDKITEVKH